MNCPGLKKYIHTHICICVYIYVYMCICVYIHVCIYMSHKNKILRNCKNYNEVGEKDDEWLSGGLFSGICLFYFKKSEKGLNFKYLKICSNIVVS